MAVKTDKPTPNKKAFKFKIHPNEEQKTLINKIIGCSRFVFNHILKENLDLFESKRKRLSKVDAIKRLPSLKNEYTWLNECDSISLQASIEYQYEGFKRYNKQNKKELKKRVLRKLSEGYQPTEYDCKGHPKFKSRKNPLQSYTTKRVNGNIDIKGNHIKLPKIGWVRFSKSRDIEGTIKRVTVSRSNLGRYSVSIICEVPYSPFKPSVNKSIGLDMGLKTFAVCSNGTTIPNPKTYKKYEKRLGFLQRALSRKTEGSNGYKHNLKQIQKLHEKIKNIRNDFLHKLTTRLVHENQVIGVETLRVKKMIENKELAKEVHDVSWSTFITQLDYKAKWYGRKLIKIDAFFPSSQLCSTCGYQNEKVKNLALRTWSCPSCDAQHDRDENASINIEKEALRLLATL